MNLKVLGSAACFNVAKDALMWHLLIHFISMFLFCSDCLLTQLEKVLLCVLSFSYLSSVKALIGIISMTTSSNEGFWNKKWDDAFVLT